MHLVARLLRRRAAAAGTPMLSRGRRVFRRALSSAPPRVFAASDDSEYFRLAVNQLRRQTDMDVDLEALQAAVACCHTREQLDALLASASASGSPASPSPLVGRLLLLACARFGALPEATEIVERTLRGGCSDSDAQVLLQGLVRMCSTVEELAAVVELGPSGSRSRLPARNSSAAFEALLWAALGANAAPLAACVVAAWRDTGEGASAASAWLDLHVVRPATETSAALERQQQQQQQGDGQRGMRGRASSFFRGFLSTGAVGGVSGAVLARVRAGQDVLLAPDGSLRDAAVAALAQLPESTLSEAGRAAPPALRLHAVRALAPAHSQLLLRLAQSPGSDVSVRGRALLDRHAAFIASVCETSPPSPWSVAWDCALALVTADTAAGTAPPHALVSALQERSELCADGRAPPLSVAQGCDVLQALLDCPPSTTHNPATACSRAFCAVVRSRPAAFASDAEVGFLLLAVSATLLPRGPSHATDETCVLEALRLAAKSAPAVSDAGSGPALGSSVGDVSLELLLRRRDGARQATAWWLSPLVARFPPVFDASLPPPSYLRELSRETGARVDWFDELGHAGAGVDIDAVMLLRTRLRSGGAFLTGYFAEGVDALAARPENVFSLAASHGSRQKRCGVVEEWAAAGPKATTLLQRFVALLRSPPPLSTEPMGDGTPSESPIVGDPRTLPSCVCAALPRLVDALIASALAPAEGPEEVPASPRPLLPPALRTAVAALDVARRAERAVATGRIRPMTRRSLELTAAALLSPTLSDGALLPPLDLRVWLALRGADAGIPLPPGAAASIARLCADAAVAQQLEDDSAEGAASCESGGEAALHGAVLPLPGFCVVNKHGVNRVVARLLPPSPDRCTIAQALALALVAIGRPDRALDLPVLVAPGATDVSCPSRKQWSWGYTTLRGLLGGGGGGAAATAAAAGRAGAVAQVPSEDAFAAAAAVAAALVLHGQAAAAAHLVLEALASPGAAAGGAAAELACGAVADAVFGACCDRGLVLEAAALLALRAQHASAAAAALPAGTTPQLSSSSAQDDEAAASAVRSALLIGAQARLIGDLLELHVGSGNVLRGRLLSAALGGDGDEEESSGASAAAWAPPTRDTRPSVPLRLAMRVRDAPPVHEPPGPSALAAAAAKICPETVALLLPRSGATRPVVPASSNGGDAGAGSALPLMPGAVASSGGGGFLALSVSISVPEGRFAADDGPVSLDASAGRGGFCLAATLLRPEEGEGGDEDAAHLPSPPRRPWLTAAGRRQTSLLAAALPCGGPLHAAWHADGPDPLGPIALAAGTTGQALAALLRRAAGSFGSATGRQGASGELLSPEEAAAVLRLQEAAASLADAVAGDARRAVDALSDADKRHPAVIAALFALAAAGGQAHTIDLRALQGQAGLPDEAMQRCHDAVVQGVAAAVPSLSTPTLRWLLFHASPTDVLRVGLHTPLPAEEAEAAVSAGGKAQRATVPPPPSVIARVRATIAAYGNLLQLVSASPPPAAVTEGAAARAATPPATAAPPPAPGRAGSEALRGAAARFWEMRVRGLRPAGETYAALLGAAGRQVSSGHALSVFGDMRVSGRLPLGGGGGAGGVAAAAARGGASSGARVE